MSNSQYELSGVSVRRPTVIRRTRVQKLQQSEEGYTQHKPAKPQPQPSTFYDFASDPASTECDPIVIFASTILILLDVWHAYCPHWPVFVRSLCASSGKVSERALWLGTSAHQDDPAAVLEWHGRPDDILEDVCLTPCFQAAYRLLLFRGWFPDWLIAPKLAERDAALAQSGWPTAAEVIELRETYPALFAYNPEAVRRLVHLNDNGALSDNGHESDRPDCRVLLPAEVWQAAYDIFTHSRAMCRYKQRAEFSRMLFRDWEQNPSRTKPRDAIRLWRAQSLVKTRYPSPLRNEVDVNEEQTEYDYEDDADYDVYIYVTEVTGR